MYDYPAPPPKPFHFSLNLGAIIKLPTNPGIDIAYTDLVCTEQDKQNIIEIITTVAENNKLSLLMKQSHLRNLGSLINHVHPLKFVAISLSTPYLKSCYMNIFDDYFKKNGVMDGLGPSLTREAEKGKIELYLKPFAKEMGVSPEDIRPFTLEQNWEGLLQFLMNS